RSWRIVLFLCPRGLIGRARLCRGARRCPRVQGSRDVPVIRKSWPRSERPRERLLQVGPQSLSDGELVALLLGSGTRGENVSELATSLLERWGGLAALLASSPAEPARARGLGPAR